MNLTDLFESGDPITPKITWKTNGDKSYTVRIEYAPDKVYVHTNKDHRALEKLVKERYGPRKFS